MGGCGDEFFSAYEDMNQFGSLINIGFRDSSKRLFASFFIPGPDIIANYNILNGFATFVQQNYCSAEPIPLELQPHQGLLRPEKSIILLSIISCCCQKSTSKDR